MIYSLIFLNITTFQKTIDTFSMTHKWFYLKLNQLFVISISFVWLKLTSESNTIFSIDSAIFKFCLIQHIVFLSELNNRCYGYLWPNAEAGRKEGNILWKLMTLSNVPDVEWLLICSNWVCHEWAGESFPSSNLPTAFIPSSSLTTALSLKELPGLLAVIHEAAIHSSPLLKRVGQFYHRQSPISISFVNSAPWSRVALNSLA